MDQITIPRPTDGHVHVRGKPLIAAVLRHTARDCARAVLMPNDPWIDDVEPYHRHAQLVRDELALLGYDHFTPLLTVALTDDMAADGQARLRRILRDCRPFACKLYPAGSTTGTRDADGQLRGVYSPLSTAMLAAYALLAEHQVALLVHCEKPQGPRLNRESRYLPTVAAIASQNPTLRVVVEHGSTAAMVAWVCHHAPANVALSLTLHHLVDTLDDALESPDSLCNPVPKAVEDREALWQAIESGFNRCYLGSDSAPHPRGNKYCRRPACGAFTAPGLFPRLAEQFAARDLLPRLAEFTSANFERFHGLAPAGGTLTLARDPWRVPESFGGVAAGEIIDVWRGGDLCTWSVRLFSE